MKRLSGSFSVLNVVTCMCVKEAEVQKLFSVEVFVFLQPLILSLPHSDPVLQSEDPFVVRLLFEPSGRPDSQQDYYLTAKENLCVVCGKVDSYIRCDLY